MNKEKKHLVFGSQMTSSVDSGMQGSHAFTPQNNSVRTSQKSCTVPITLAEKN